MLEPAFVLWGAPVTWLEIAAFVLALGCVVLNVLEIHWGWGLAILSSLLYGWLFLDSRLYGESGLQVFFVAVAVWGWWQWLYGRRRGGETSAAARDVLERPWTGGGAALDGRAAIRRGGACASRGSTPAGAGSH
jgi:nicotinamide mononucleotide transporter